MTNPAHTEPRPDDPMAVEINSVRKSYSIGKMEVPILHGIDLAIRRGEFLAIMGPSGSGKSALMNSIGCLDRLTGGEIHIPGKDISKDSIRVHDEHAFGYDREARETGWFGPEVLFGLCFEYVRPHERLLDIGIGTGLGSMLFARAGLEVFGIDGSAEMLEICRSKDFAEDLREFDLRGMPLPYSDGSFDDAIHMTTMISLLTYYNEHAEAYGNMNGMKSLCSGSVLKSGVPDFRICREWTRRSGRSAWSEESLWGGTAVRTRKVDYPTHTIRSGT
jgi:ABC-type dipeptide/oligopeptide/nickel transport system ATPase component